MGLDHQASRLHIHTVDHRGANVLLNRGGVGRRGGVHAQKGLAESEGHFLVAGGHDALLE
jgi:hypothetical protein